MNTGLAGRTAVVTGAGAGIGLAITRSLLDEGMRVVAADLDCTRLSELDGELEAVEGDLATPQAPGDLVARAVERFGAVDVLVNNVGAYPWRDGFLSTSDEDWLWAVQLNLLCTVRACRAAIPHMVDAGRGSIVTIATDLARVPEPHFPDYCAIKAAVITLAKTLSLEFGPAGVRSNCVSPGPTRTEAWDAEDGFATALAAEHGLDPEAALQHFVDEVTHTPLRRLGAPDDIARAVTFLASDAASHITGVDLRVDGGQTNIA